VIRTLLALLGVLLLLAVSAGPGTPAAGPAASGDAFALRVAGVTVGAVGGAASSSGSVGGYAYPADGSIVRMGAGSAMLTVAAGSEASVQSGADVSSVSIFNGEITVGSVSVRASASASSTAGAAATDGSSVGSVVALGQAVPPGGSAALADWGTVAVLAGSVDRETTSDATSGQAAVTGVRITLSAEHGGLPAGSEIVVGYAGATASLELEKEPSAPTTTTTTPAPKGTPKPNATTGRPKPPAATAAQAARAAAKAFKDNRGRLPEPPEHESGSSGAPHPPEFRLPPAGINAELTPGRYVFPVYGDVGFGNTFGAPRASTGWHHGEDLFGELGQPILAVADGTIFSVGWNDIGGYRLWLRDRSGNQYYYAHLSAFSSLAVNGREVKAGQVIAFMGNTGEAITTPVHLHFEIHPVSMLQFGYDGAIEPYRYLLAWQRLEDVPFSLGQNWVPILPVRANAPRPGAILLLSSDISSASGLDPRSLQRALVAPTEEGDGALVVGRG
jgi:murein DD-endopeptidase MepM/ murein hydrolase activator NlpD